MGVGRGGHKTLLTRKSLFTEDFDDDNLMMMMMTMIVYI